jgi:SAM-dependent methyltransferase
MTFDKEFWDEHWSGGGSPVEVNPHLVAALGGVTPGRALDGGAGAGNEARWLAAHGWAVTAVDISARPSEPSSDVDWVTADLTTWEPGATFDLVTTFYAHAAVPQLDLYERIARWVAPGGILLIVGHLHDGHHPDEASVTSADIVARLGDGWRIDLAEDTVRDLATHATRLADAVVRATRDIGVNEVDIN